MTDDGGTTRRGFLRATGAAAGVTAVAGCNAVVDGGDGGEPGGTDTGGDEPSDTATETDTDTDTATPSYELHAADLEYDLTGFAVAEANRHDRAHVEANYSSELELTVFEGGERADVDPPSDVRVLDREGGDVATTEGGAIPEYAVRDGQELTVRAELEGQTLEDTATVSKSLPRDYDVTLEYGAGEEAPLGEFVDELGEVYLETPEGDVVEASRYGTVPGGTIEEGQELVLRRAPDGEAIDTLTVVSVDEHRPADFIVDARLVADGETVLHHWSTPYRFDAEIGDPDRVAEDNTYEVTREASHRQRARRREELAAEQVITDSDLETIAENVDTLEEERDFGERRLIRTYFRSFNLAMKGEAGFEGSDASPNAVNMEAAMVEHSPFAPAYHGGFVNPAEPEVPTSGDGDGFAVTTQLAYVAGDFYQVGQYNTNAHHIENADEARIAKDVENTSGASFLAVSVLGEFEEGDTDLLAFRDPDRLVRRAVTSPVTLGHTLGGDIDMSDEISWETLRSIRRNRDWTEVMAPIELAVAVQTDNEDADIVEIAGTDPGDTRIRLH
jgi:hypothetical protein